MSYRKDQHKQQKKGKQRRHHGKPQEPMTLKRFTCEAMDVMYRLFEGDIPDDNWRYDGQTFGERCEAWLLHAVDQVEEELDSGGDGDDEDQEEDDE